MFYGYNVYFTAPGLLCCLCFQNGTKLCYFLFKLLDLTLFQFRHFVAEERNSILVCLCSEKTQFVCVSHPVRWSRS